MEFLLTAKASLVDVSMKQNSLLLGIIFIIKDNSKIYSTVDTMVYENHIGVL